MSADRSSLIPFRPRMTFAQRQALCEAVSEARLRQMQTDHQPTPDSQSTRRPGESWRDCGVRQARWEATVDRRIRARIIAGAERG